MKKKKHPVAAEKADYIISERERTTLKKQLDRMAAQTPAPRIKVPKEKPNTIDLDHSDYTVGRAILAEALGTADLDFVDGILEQLAIARSDTRGLDERKMNFLLSVIKGIHPKDQLETMLAAQMAVVHMATMKFAQHFSCVETLPQLDSTERAVNKLARTFAIQLEALKRYRTGGEQKVTVQHVTVGEGGQAIVGNVTQATPNAAAKKPADATPALTHSQQPSMKMIEERERTPVAAQLKQKNDGRSSA